MSHLKRLHGQRRQAMVDLFADENKEWRAKWLKNLRLEPDPAGLKVCFQQRRLCSLYTSPNIAADSRKESYYRYRRPGFARTSTRNKE